MLSFIKFNLIVVKSNLDPLEKKFFVTLGDIYFSRRDESEHSGNIAADMRLWVVQ